MSNKALSDKAFVCLACGSAVGCISHSGYTHWSCHNRCCENQYTENGRGVRKPAWVGYSGALWYPYVDSL